MNAKTTTRRIFVAAPLIGLAVLGGAGLATAGTLPTDGDTIAMTITNNTGTTMTLTGDYTNSGDFISGPRQSLAPGQSEIVTASTKGFDGLTAVVNYGLPDTNTIVTFEANNTPNGATAEGTSINGIHAGSYGYTSSIDTGAPNMNAAYSVYHN